jgi:hypothetical protein
MAIIIFLILFVFVLYMYNINQKNARIQERQKNEEEKRIYQNTIDTHKDLINNLIESIKASKDVNEQIKILKEKEHLISTLEKKLEEEEPNIYFAILFKKKKKIILTELRKWCFITLFGFVMLYLLSFIFSDYVFYNVDDIKLANSIIETINLVWRLTLLNTIRIAIKYAILLFKKPKTID